MTRPPLQAGRIHPEALERLRLDPVMATLIDRVGVLEYSVEPDLWRAIVGSIVGQQLSLAAAATIRGRIAALGSNGYPTPAELFSAPDEILRACGLSRAKVSYVRDAARAWLEGEIKPDEIARLGDEDVIEQLVRLRGVGRWTAEMVLIFSLDRPDVLAVDDLGIKVAVQRAYGLDARPAKAELEEIGSRWRPFRSHASRYLWRSLKV
jgi:DNA-3-methyladenine glycosylase II